MVFKTKSGLISGHTSFLLLIAMTCLLVAVAMTKLPPAFGGMIVVGLIVFVVTFINTEAGLHLLIVSGT